MTTKDGRGASKDMNKAMRFDCKRRLDRRQRRCDGRSFAVDSNSTVTVVSEDRACTLRNFSSRLRSSAQPVAQNRLARILMAGAACCRRDEKRSDGTAGISKAGRRSAGDPDA